MQLFKLQPIYFDKALWSDSTAYTVTSTVEASPAIIDDHYRTKWKPFTSYSITASVRRGQYVYYSTKGGNYDDPFYNYIGIDLTTNPHYSDEEWRLTKGRDSWIKGRCLHDFDCINYASPGATQHTGNMTIQFIPKAMGDSVDMEVFYGDDNPKYLIMSGVSAQQITVETYDLYNALIDTKVFNSDENINTQKRIIRDVNAATVASPELPAILKDTLFISYDNENTNKFVITMTSGNTGSNVKIKHLSIGKKYTVGHSMAQDLSIGGVDYSRVNYDDWGRMTLVPGKRAKTIKATVALTGQAALQEETAIKLLQSCRATPTIFYLKNTLIPDTFVSSLPFITGLIGRVSVDEISKVYKRLDFQIDGIPVDYNP